MGSATRFCSPYSRFAGSRDKPLHGQLVQIRLASMSSCNCARDREKVVPAVDPGRMHNRRTPAVRPMRLPIGCTSSTMTSLLARHGLATLVGRMPLHLGARALSPADTRSATRSARRCRSSPIRAARSRLQLDLGRPHRHVADVLCSLSPAFARPHGREKYEAGCHALVEAADSPSSRPRLLYWNWRNAIRGRPPGNCSTMTESRQTNELELDRAAHLAPLIDPFGRAISYLRVSVTDRCDFRCVYCMAENMSFLPGRRHPVARRARPPVLGLRRPRGAQASSYRR